MSRFAFEHAGDRHEPGLRRLFAESEMDGDIRISFRREPNYFWATRLFGPFCQVIAALDSASGAVIGAGTRAIREAFINGKVQPVGYLADLRLDRHHRNGTLIGRAYRHLKTLHLDRQAQLYFTVIAAGNRTALATIATGRAGLPRYYDYGQIHCPAINLLGRKVSRDSNPQIARATLGQLPEIIECINRNHARRQFAPHYTIDQFVASTGNGTAKENGEATGTRLRDLNVEEFYVARRGGKIVGVLGKWDQSAFKQTVVTGYGMKTRALRPVYNLTSAALGWPRYPSIGKPLKFFYASFIAVDDDDVNVFRALLRQLYNDHVRTNYHYFLLGLHENDPLAAALSDYVVTRFSARLFVVCFPDGEELFAALDNRPPYVELALL